MLNFLINVLAVIVGLLVYAQIKDFAHVRELNKQHKKLLGWKKETEDNILAGNKVEENKRILGVTEASLAEFYKNSSKEHFEWGKRK